jgi:hypothetical protein
MASPLIFHDAGIFSCYILSSHKNQLSDKNPLFFSTKKIVENFVKITKSRLVMSGTIVISIVAA